MDTEENMPFAFDSDEQQESEEDYTANLGQLDMLKDEYKHGKRKLSVLKRAQRSNFANISELSYIQEQIQTHAKAKLEQEELAYCHFITEKMLYWLCIFSCIISVIYYWISLRELEILLIAINASYCYIKFWIQLINLRNYKRIGLWKRVHNFIACVMITIIIKWSKNTSWHHFKNFYLILNTYTSLFHIISYKTQYKEDNRLVTWGNTPIIYVGIEGFHTLMIWQKNFLIIPISYIVICWEVYYFFVLGNLFKEFPAVWEITVLADLHLILGMGNMIAISNALITKFNIIPVLKKYLGIEVTPQSNMINATSQEIDDGENTTPNEEEAGRDEDPESYIPDDREEDEQNLLYPTEAQREATINADYAGDAKSTESTHPVSQEIKKHI